MNQAIIIGTTPTTSPWLDQCLKSLEGYNKYPIVILSDYTWELGKIKWIYDHTDLDEFLFLPDTAIIKKTKILDKIFGEFQGKSVAFHHFGNSYMVKYRREILDKMILPKVNSKPETIFHETWWNKAYFSLDPAEVLFPELSDAIEPEKIEEKFGRQNLKMENDWFCKWKGTWDVSQYTPLEMEFNYFK